MEVTIGGRKEGRGKRSAATGPASCVFFLKDWYGFYQDAHLRYRHRYHILLSASKGEFGASPERVWCGSKQARDSHVAEEP